MIVKIQRPLISTQEDPPVLIYNRSRTHEIEVPYSNVQSMFEPPEAIDNPLKIYVKAKMKGTLLHLGRRVEDQDW